MMETAHRQKIIAEVEESPKIFLGLCTEVQRVKGRKCVKNRNY